MLHLFLHGLSFLLGACFGVALVCILQAGKQADKEMEQLRPTQKKEQEEFSE